MQKTREIRTPSRCSSRTATSLAVLFRTTGALSLLLLWGCSGSNGPLPAALSDCSADHALVGATATLETHFHSVAGTVTVIDNCTVELTNFTFDGQGLDVRAVLSDSPDFDSYDILSEDLRADGPYEDAALSLPLREGMTLDGITDFSIWCVPAGASFGDGSFALP